MFSFGMITLDNTVFLIFLKTSLTQLQPDFKYMHDKIQTKQN